MDRDVLKIFLRSGPALKFDVLQGTRSQYMLPDEEKEYLFATPVLNYSILFKALSSVDDLDIDDSNPIGTLVYLPYDHNRPEEGGESFMFSEEDFHKFYNHKLPATSIDFESYDADRRRLEILDSIPTFSPMILELAFERSDIRAPKSYLNLPPELREKLKGNLKARIRPLIVAAFDQTATDVDKAIEDMTTKLLLLKNMKDIMPLIEALRLPPENAQEILSSWIGLTYFEFEYSSIQIGLKDFSNWLANHTLPQENSKYSEKHLYANNVIFLRKRLKEDWSRIVMLNADYKKSYNDMIFKSNIKGFSSFLLKCKSAYWEMGEILGRLEQTTIAWKRFERILKSDSASLRNFNQFLSLLRAVHVNTKIADEDGASSTKGPSNTLNLNADLF